MPRAVVLVVCWSIPGVLSAVQTWLLQADRPAPLADYLTQIPPWWVWAAATPALGRLADRYPVLGRGLPVHVAALAVMNLAHASVLAVTTGLARMSIAEYPMPFRLWILSLKTSFVAVLAYAAVLAIHHALAQRRTRAALELELARAQLAALRLQIRPHFLFNTLNTIAMQIRTGAGPAAVEMLSTLGALLRETLDDSEPEVALERELATVRRWLAIEQVRFGDRLRVAWDIAPGCERARVPAFVVQPLVENALRHGLADRPEGGEVAIRAHRTGDQLVLEVLDDGAGLRTPHQPRVGLANVRDRLARLHPGAWELRVTARPEGRGVCAAVTLPYREATP